MRVLVTGADGFVGSVIGRALRSRGHDVVGTVFLRAPGEGELAVDVTRPAELERIPAGRFDAMVHNAGIVASGVPRKRMFTVNAGGTRNALAFAAARGVEHFVQISSIGVYGARAMGEERSERRTPRQRFGGVAYQRSKAAAEAAVMRSGVPFTALRLPAILGRGDTVMTPAIAGHLAAGTLFRCGRAGKRVTVLDVEFLGPVLERVLALGPAGRAMNCGSHHVPWDEVLATYAEALGVPLAPARRSILAATWNFHDHEWMFLATSSRFGAHFPTDLLTERLGALEVAHRLAARRAAEDGGFNREKRGTRRHVHFKGPGERRAIEQDRLLRQPGDPRALADL